MDNALKKDLNIYCLSGLGADYRLFTAFKPLYGNMHPLPYVAPLTQTESLAAYAQRLADTIDNTKPFVLVGVSLGGLLATEIAHFTNPIGIVYLSTIKSGDALSFRLKLLKFTKLYKVFTFRFLQRYLYLFKWYFKSTAHYQLFKTMLLDCSVEFGQWALEKSLNWEGKAVQVPFLHINGSADELFPEKNKKDTLYLPQARHDMTLYKWDELNSLINPWLRALLYQ